MEYLKNDCEFRDQLMKGNHNDMPYKDLGGTIRYRSPEETLRNISPLLKTMGITRVADVTGLDTIGIPVFNCFRPNSKNLSVSQGKGITPELAKISAIMESIESYHFEEPNLEKKYGSYNNFLKISKNFIHPKHFGYVGPYNIDLADLPLEWIECRNILTKSTCFIPFATSQNDTTQLKDKSNWFFISTNGLAAGNTYEEALCHALFEVIERDSLSRWFELDIADRLKTRVSLKTVYDPVNKFLLKKFDSAKILVKVWDVTSDLGIPTYHCAIYEENIIRNHGIHQGTGTHLSARIALSRALTEAAQSRLTHITGSRDDIPLQYYQNKSDIDFWYYDTFEKEFIEKNYDDINTFDQCLKYLLDRMKILDINSVFFVNLTKPHIGIPVVQVQIPQFKFDILRV